MNAGCNSRARRIIRRHTNSIKMDALIKKTQSEIASLIYEQFASAILGHHTMMCQLESKLTPTRLTGNIQRIDFTQCQSIDILNTIFLPLSHQPALTVSFRRFIATCSVLLPDNIIKL